MAGLFSSQDKNLSCNRVSADILNREAVEHFSCSDHYVNPLPLGVPEEKDNRGERRDPFQVLLPTLFSLK